VAEVLLEAAPVHDDLALALDQAHARDARLPPASAGEERGVGGHAGVSPSSFPSSDAELSDSGWVASGSFAATVADVASDAAVSAAFAWASAIAAALGSITAVSWSAVSDLVAAAELVLDLAAAGSRCLGASGAAAAADMALCASA